MEQLLQFFILIPFLGFIVSIFLKQKNETSIAGLAISSVGIHLIGLFVFIGYWLINKAPSLDIKHFTFYKEDNIEIFIDFYFDKITAVFALVGSIITFLVAIFSRYYLHRDSGFKRFFITLLFFYFAYSLLLFSGNFFEKNLGAY